jgi:hypothetical protein
VGGFEPGNGRNKSKRIQNAPSSLARAPLGVLYSIPKTGFPVRTERQYGGLKSGSQRFRDPAPPGFVGHCGALVVTARDAVLTERRILMKLTDTQLVLLPAASPRQDDTIELRLL